MIGQLGIGTQAEADFAHARRRASLRRAISRLRGASEDLPVFEDVRKSLGAFNRIPPSMRTVELREIVGTVGRRHDFDACFFPARSSVSGRWERVDRAFHKGEELPAVDLYKIGSAYFVMDGNHRVSVARYQDAETIDAMVVEFRPARSSLASLPTLPESCSGWRPRLRSKLRSVFYGRPPRAPT